MGALKIVGGVLAAGLILIIAFYGYLGGFYTVGVERGTYGPTEIVYTTHRGAYEKIGKSWEMFQSDWEQAGLNRCNSLAVYLDAPDTPKQGLRSVLACRIDALPDAEKALWRATFPGMMLPKSEALISAFPYKNYASFMLAPVRVYPEMQERMLADSLDGTIAIEEYGIIGETKEIRIIMPIEIDRSAYRPLMDAF